jgi:hypothetical protein
VYIGSISEDEYAGPYYGFLHAFRAGIPNNPPSKPVFSGPRVGLVGREYEYTIVASDPDGEDVSYYISWAGAGDQAFWYGPYPSGEKVTVSHTWEEPWPGPIVAKARDSFGEDSEVVELEVMVSKNRVLGVWFFGRFERCSWLCSATYHNH